MKAIILAGGYGRGFKPRFLYKPGNLIMLANKPFLLYQLELVKAHDIDDITLCIGQHSRVIEKTFGDGRTLELNLGYSFEEEPLGTAGAIKAAVNADDQGPFFVLNGDILSDINITEMLEKHRDNRASVTIALKSVHTSIGFGQVICDDAGHITSFLEKPSFGEVQSPVVNAGAYIMERSAIDLIPADRYCSLERYLFPELVREKIPLRGYMHQGYWLDAGDTDRYYQANRDILQGRIQTAMVGTCQDNDIWMSENFEFEAPLDLFGPIIIGKNVKAGSHVTLAGHSVIGDNCVIGSGTRIENTVMMNNCIIGENVHLQCCMLGEASEIGSNSSVSGGKKPAILGPDSYLGDETRI